MRTETLLKGKGGERETLMLLKEEGLRKHCDIE